MTTRWKDVRALGALVVVWGLATSPQVLAQQHDPEARDTPVSEPMVVITIAVSVVACITLVGILLHMIRMKQAWTPATVTAFCIPLFVFGALLIIVGGYGYKKILAVLGLFASIAGYLLGQHSSSIAEAAVERHAAQPEAHVGRPRRPSRKGDEPQS
ncbi:hypothetical protein [Sandaracinus amylolyticus]|uniref:hypothetical protein n=1 Tax=Sandaracinus amylolyticus TaxID=927083 RepID=UPI001F37EBEB|nr:hypothetical protein [Sandaracinus amylolyticus]UJR79019.1 Hypothetical protein I5071_10520 [Sandaracinus amylolyticus]